MRILFIGTGWSPHLARWINQVSDQGWDLHLFPLNADEGINPDLKNMTVHDAVHGRPPGADPSVRAVYDFWPRVKDGYPFARGAMTARRIERRFFPQRAERAWRLAQAIKQVQPDIIHSMTIWPGSDLVMQARQYLTGPFPTWIVSSWGSDIYLFPRLDKYAAQSRAVLEQCDYFITDCRRDIELARSYGFKGELLGVFPGAGGFDVAEMERVPRTQPTSERRLILMKGQQHIAGRGLVAVRALELCADALGDYRIATFYSDDYVNAALELLSKRTGLKTEVIPKVPYDELFRLYGQARLMLGLSISDGLPLSVLEAMFMGVFPVQSNTCCADEWLKDGESCIFVHPEDPEQVAAAIRRAVTDDALVDRAAALNLSIAAEHFDEARIKPQVVEMYRKVMSQPVPSKSGA